MEHQQWDTKLNMLRHNYLRQLRLDSMFNINGRIINKDTPTYIIAELSNTDQYNGMTEKDLGSKLTGYYYEIGYNLMDGIIPSISSATEELIAFARYENYNTHAETEGVAINNAYNRTEITFGLGFKVAQGAVFKADYQIKSDASSEEETGQIKLGIGVWF